MEIVLCAEAQPCNWRVMRIMRVVMCIMLLVTCFEVHRTCECSEPHAEGVVGGDSCGEQSKPTEELEVTAFGAECCGEDRVLREKRSRERECAQPQASKKREVTHESEARNLAES